MPKRSNRIIIDTNLWISFLLTRKLNFLDALFQNKEITVLFSKELLDEFVEVATRTKFKKYISQSELQELITKVKAHAEFVIVSSVVDSYRDPKDNFLLALSKDGKAKFLITGDKDLLEIKHFGKTTILTFTEFKSL